MLNSQQEAAQILRERALEKGTMSQRKVLFEQIPKEGDLTAKHVRRLAYFFADVKGAGALAEEAELLRKWIAGELP